MQKIKFLLCLILCLGFLGCTQDDVATNNNAVVTTNLNVEVPEQEDVSGTPDEDFAVEINVKDKVYFGHTFMPDNYNTEGPRVVEINMSGEVVWEYLLPEDLKSYTNPGLDAELLENDNFLLTLPRYGIQEITRDGEVVWEHLDSKISHDADRLANGNTLYVYGAKDKKEDAQVKEVNTNGELVWSWSAKDDFLKEPYQDIDNDGWTHTNAAVRLKNGNTLISPRNFNCLVEVNPAGETVRILGADFLEEAHDPEELENGNILVADHGRPQSVVEFNPNTDEIVWEFIMPEKKTWPIRDANRLPNGNTLITGTSVLAEVTADDTLVWELRLQNVDWDDPNRAPTHGFFKAERINP